MHSYIKVCYRSKLKFHIPISKITVIHAYISHFSFSVLSRLQILFSLCVMWLVYWLRIVPKMYLSVNLSSGSYRPTLLTETAPGWRAFPCVKAMEPSHIHH